MPRSYDLAHLVHVELLTPHPDASLDFFVQAMGLSMSAQHGDSTYHGGTSPIRTPGRRSRTKRRASPPGARTCVAWTISICSRRA